MLFTSKSSFLTTQQLKNPSDMITIGNDSEFRFNARSATEMNDSIMELIMAGSQKKTKRHHLMLTTSDDIDTSTIANTTIQQMSQH